MYIQQKWSYGMMVIDVLTLRVQIHPNLQLRDSDLMCYNFYNFYNRLFYCLLECMYNRNSFIRYGIERKMK